MAGHLAADEVDLFLSAIRDCRGLIVFTGVGQNSLLADKVASTYGSLSMRSTSIDSVALLHGNLGMLREGDLLILLSNSGETPELLHLVESCKKIGHTDILVVHSTPGCTLERMCARSVHVPTVGEADHLDMVPTASSCCFLAFLQAVAIQIAGEQGLTADDFVATHPGGSIGSTVLEHRS
ncbi:SIS domain-containing protein [Streptomyces sp. BE147]|uniref:SIS domain-containing protein n=1 Tax=unclassified Streptomyces TaxID=2593676 RepID=UPI002E776D93|nr:SIS domain-containing protein [Streptomyces sp. BE147]MEE1736698.1 SIS domain-containing protein [Streptomyces sp. BE147]